MEQREFAGLTEAIVVRFLPRIPARYVRGFEQEIRAGEYSLAVENLVLTLVNDQIPVTPPEQEDLRRLLEHLHQPLDALDGLTLTPSA